MKKLLMVLVIAFLSLAVLGVSGCESAKAKRARLKREAKIASIKCVPERQAEKIQEVLRGADKFGITTGPTWSSSTTTEASAKQTETSGCRRIKKRKSSYYLQQQEFVAFTIDNLSEQIAQGGGPHLQALISLLGCPASDYPALADMARRDFGRLFPSAEIEPEAFLARLKDSISHDSRLSVSCVYA